MEPPRAAGEGPAAAAPAIRPQPAPASAPTWSGEVAAIVKARCATCHVPGGAEASKPLTTYAEVHALRSSVLNQVYACKMPLAGAPELEASERAALLAWLVCGAEDNCISASSRGSPARRRGRDRAAPRRGEEQSEQVAGAGTAWSTATRSCGAASIHGKKARATSSRSTRPEGEAVGEPERRLRARRSPPREGGARDELAEEDPEQRREREVPELRRRPRTGGEPSRGPWSESAPKSAPATRATGSIAGCPEDRGARGRGDEEHEPGEHARARGLRRGQSARNPCA